MISCFISLGSNLGNRVGFINKALELLSKTDGLTLVWVSRNLETDAILPPNAPKTWNKKYINCVAELKTSLAPYILLDIVKNIEKIIGRKRRKKWAPREIDIDILWYEGVFLNSNKLTIPHKELHNRVFLKILLGKKLSRITDS